MSRSTPAYRIGFCLPALTPGGMEGVTVTLANALCEQGHRVDVWVEREGGAYRARLDSRVTSRTLERATSSAAYRQLIRHWPVFGMGQWPRRLSRRLDYLPVRRLPGVVSLLRERRLDVLFVAHGRLPILALLARRIAGIATRIVVIEHSTLSRWLDAFADVPAKHAKWRYRVDLARRFYPLADQIVGVSAGVSKDLVALLGLDERRVRTIHNPVAISQGTPARPDHPWFTNAATCPLILAVGRLVAEKNFGLLIEAFARLVSERAARLMILGEGEERAALERQVETLEIAEQVCMPGWWDRPQDVMAHSDLFVLSSWFEGLGLVLVEAMATGCPVVSVDCPSGPREILCDGRLGRLVGLDDPAALARAMADTLDAPPSAERLRERARDFAPERAVAQYLELIATLCGETRSESSRGRS